SIMNTVRISGIHTESDLNAVADRLDTLGIWTLPEMYSIPGIDDGLLDGIYYTVELIRNGEYRQYTYHSPERFVKEHKEARQFVEILRLLSQEFDLPSWYKK